MLYDFSFCVRRIKFCWQKNNIDYHKSRLTLINGRIATMLIAVLVSMFFLSAIWMVGSLHFIASSLEGMSFFDAGILNAILYILFVSLPLLLGWGIFGFINNAINNAKTNHQMQKLFAQMKKNQEYSDLLARVMLKGEQATQSYYELSRFDLLIADMNELLSEFISRQRIASEEQIEYLWTKFQNGGKWSFGKVIIENYNRQPNFQQKVLVNVLADNMLSGTVLEFCARYNALIDLLSKYDQEKMFLEMVETGVMGKVYAILSPICKEVKRVKNIELKAPEVISAKAPEQPSGFSDESSEKDEFSIVLERSFSDNNSHQEPRFDATPASPTISFSEENISETQKTLNNLKREWKEVDTSSASKDSLSDLTYPFGGWTDAQNYKK